MRSLLQATLALLLCLIGAVAKADAPYLTDEKVVELARLLPEPPGENCPETVAELAQILRCQQACTSQEAARIGTQARLTANNFRDVLGPWFDEENLPKTMQLLNRVNREGKRCCDAAKQHFGRRRPHFVDPRIKPFFPRIEEPCYPSGHAVQATLLAMILSELAPQHRAVLMEQARDIGWNRIPAGLHYPSDCTAGRVLGQAIAKALLGDPNFREELAIAKKEFDDCKKDKSQPTGTSCR